MKRSEWELRDQAKFVVSVRIDKRLQGVIYLWSNGLSLETVEDSHFSRSIQDWGVQGDDNCED